MTMRISNREWESLSAYLDGQLSAKERARLEVKLQADADLRAALEDLRRTRALLRSQPRLRAPRSFALTPQMIGIEVAPLQTRRPSPVFGLVSALASLLLVVVLAGEFLTAGSRMAAEPVPAVGLQEALSAETSSADQALLQSTQATPALGEVPLAAQESDQLSSKSAASPAEQPAPLVSPSPMEAAGAEAYVYPPPQEPALGAAEAPPPEQEQIELSQLAATQAEISLPTPTEAVPEEQALRQAPQEPEQAVSDASAHPPRAEPPFWNNWRITQALLVLVALASGITALALRRAGR